MLSKNQVKLIKSLGQKKHRQDLGLFVVEGIKSVKEFIASDYETIEVYSTDANLRFKTTNLSLISEAQLKRISFYKSPNKVLAIFKIPSQKWKNSEGLVVVLDSVRDPGNLGTIIRLCDWFGVTKIVCSPTTVDCYNPKAVQASMGSLTRVDLYYLDLKSFFSDQQLPVFGTYMTGEPIYTNDLPADGIIVFGNEANGIGRDLEDYINRKISIPQFGQKDSTESLNVANAVAITLSEFRRRAIER